MASVQIKKTYGGHTGSEVFMAAKQAIVNAGYKVWKTRELANLVLGLGEVDGQEVRINVVGSMIDDSAIISIESDKLDEQALSEVADKIHGELAKLLP